MKNTIPKIFIKPFLDSRKSLSFKLKSNVEIAGIQFRMNGFSEANYYQFEDIGSIKRTSRIKSIKNKHNMSVVDAYDFNVVINSINGVIMAFSSTGDIIKPNHSFLFSIPYIINSKNRRLDKYCIRDLVISDKFANDIKFKGKYLGGCFYDKNDKDLHKIIDIGNKNEKYNKKDRILKN